MDWDLTELIKAFSKIRHPAFLVEGLHGLEKESLRVDPKGNLALTPHPKALGNSLTDPHITTDFSESQLEFITPPFSNIEKTIASLEKLHRFATPRLKNELIWPLSMPAHLPPYEEIPIAHYGKSAKAQEKETYRRGLALRYGKYMQTISGVHYNLSFSLKLWDALMKYSKTKLSKQDFINESYLHLVRNFIRYRWLLVYLFGASPNHDPTYCCKLLAHDKDNAVSLRLSRCGYSNPAKIHVTYNHFQEHLNDLKTAVATPNPAYRALGLVKNGEKQQLNDHLLQIGNEYYFPIRLKPPKPFDDVLKKLTKHGVRYIEVRIFDLNPFTPIGVTSEQLYFSQLFLLFCLFEKSPFVDEKVLAVSTENQQSVALKGRNQKLLLDQNGKKIPMLKWAEQLLKAMKPLAKLLDQNFKKSKYTKLLSHYLKSLQDPKTLPAFRILKEMEQKKVDFLHYGLQKAKANAKSLR